MIGSCGPLGPSPGAGGQCSVVLAAMPVSEAAGTYVIR